MDGDFIKKQGLPFMTHVLWRLQEHIVRACATWGVEGGYVAPPRTHSTMQALHEHGPLSVTELALVLRQSHPLVITWIRQLRELGLVEAGSDPKDGRRTILSLTTAGEAEIEALKAARVLIERAFETLMAEAEAPVFEPLWRMEEALRREGFLERLRRESEREGIAGQEGDRVENLQGRRAG